MLAEGSTVNGRYRLTSLIGEGGMASVWRALDETLQRPVAIKLLYFRAHRDPQQAVEQFLREARIAASIQHRNVVQTVDFGTTDAAIPYMVMELLQGESLAARMERAPRLGTSEMLRIANLTLRGLAAVHEAGIVHRDLKPQNIFLQQDGDDWYPKILDFGISRSVTPSDERPSPIATQQGLVIGTPHYMSPEQARGEAEIDRRSDIYSMGAIIYEVLTGRLPFDAETAGELLVKILSGEPPAMHAVNPDVPELLSDCVAQAMAHDREHRFIDAKAFRRALQSAAEGSLIDIAPRGSEGPEQKTEAQRSEVQAAALQVATGVQTPANDVQTKAPAWGDFEGLAGRSERPSPARAASPPAAAAVAGRAAAGVRVAARGVSEPLSTSADALPRTASGPPSAAGTARAASAPLSAAGAASAPRVGSGALSAGRAASAPLSVAGGAIAPARAPSGPLSNVRAAPARAPSGPIARGSLPKAPPGGTGPEGSAAADGPMMGDNPLDAFAESSGALLDIDYGPSGNTRVSRQSPAPRGPKRIGTTGHLSMEDRKASLKSARRGPSALWILPAFLLLIVFVLLLAPGLFSAPPPDESAAIQQEARNPATRGSDRTLSSARADDLAKTPRDSH